MVHYSAKKLAKIVNTSLKTSRALSVQEKAAGLAEENRQEVVDCTYLWSSGRDNRFQALTTPSYDIRPCRKPITRLLYL